MYGRRGLIFINEIRLLYDEYPRCDDKKIKQMIHDDILSLIEAIEEKVNNKVKSHL